MSVTAPIRVEPDGRTVPRRYQVVDWIEELDDTVTLVLEPVDEPIVRPEPGQFTMLWVPRVGEIAVSVSRVDGHLLHQTIREVGAVSAALCARRIDDEVGVRGPFGSRWPVPTPGQRQLIVAGGLGLAPLRPSVEAAVAAADDDDIPFVLSGARSPDVLLYREELEYLRTSGVAEVRLTVDEADAAWGGPVGLVTTLLDTIELDHRATTALLCGPEVMMRATAMALMRRRVPVERIWVSLERSMACGHARCGRCQLGPLLLCRDGPVIRYDVAEPLLQVRDR